MKENVLNLQYHHEQNLCKSQHGEKGTEHKFLPQATTLSKGIV